VLIQCVPLVDIDNHTVGVNYAGHWTEKTMPAVFIYIVARNNK